MVSVGNLLWLIFGGLIIIVLRLIGGIVFCITIIGIPLGLQIFRTTPQLFCPVGKRVEVATEHTAGSYLAYNMVWFLLFGWIIVLVQVLFAIVLTITILGIPIALQHIKVIPESIFPFGYQLVPM